MGCASSKPEAVESLEPRSPKETDSGTAVPLAANQAASLPSAATSVEEEATDLDVLKQELKKAAAGAARRAAAAQQKGEAELAAEAEAAAKEAAATAAKEAAAAEAAVSAADARKEEEAAAAAVLQNAKAEEAAAAAAQVAADQQAVTAEAAAEEVRTSWVQRFWDWYRPAPRLNILATTSLHYNPTFIPLPHPPPLYLYYLPAFSTSPPPCLFLLASCTYIFASPHGRPRGRKSVAAAAVAKEAAEEAGRVTEMAAAGSAVAAEKATAANKAAAAAVIVAAAKTKAAKAAEKNFQRVFHSEFKRKYNTELKPGWLDKVPLVGVITLDGARSVCLASTPHPPTPPPCNAPHIISRSISSSPLGTPT